MARAPSNRERLLTLLQAYTQREAASILGVSERTVRRWKNQESTPTKNLDVLQREAAKIRRRILRQPQRYEQKFHVPRTPVVPIGERRSLRVYDSRGEWTGAYIESDWVNYDVRTWEPERIADLLAYLRDRGLTTIQLIYWRPAFTDSPTGRGRKVTRKAAGQGASPIMSIEGMDNAELSDLVDDFRMQSTQPGHARGRILYVGVIQ